MAYDLQPGTIPYRAFALLSELAPKTEMSSAALADGLGIEQAGLTSCLSRAAEAGILKRRKGVSPAQRPCWFWSVGDGTGEPRAEDHEHDEPLRTATTKLPARPVSVFTMGPEIALETLVDRPKGDHAAGAATGVTQPEPPPLDVREYVQRIGPEPGPVSAARPFDAWLSAHGALLLQGVTLDEDGDAMIQPKDVARLRVLLQGLAS